MDSEAKKFLGLDDVGIQMEYRCSRCRDCADCHKGEQYKKMSIRQEREQAMIRESIKIDKDQKRAVARLPFRVKPEDYLTNNKNVSAKMLERVCKKYYQDKEVVDLVMKVFTKLFTNGHLLLL